MPLSLMSRFSFRILKFDTPGRVQPLKMKVLKLGCTDRPRLTGRHQFLHGLERVWVAFGYCNVD